MKYLNTIGALAATMLFLPSQTLAGVQYKGFSMGAITANGDCKSEADWETDFKTIKGWGKGFNAVRLSASSDCGALAKAVPAAVRTGMKVLVGVWATDTNHYNAEKAALRQAIRKHGTGWIAAVSVGSEDLYWKNLPPAALASQVYDVRGMVRRYDKSIKVGHADIWTAWVDGANDIVARACDIIIINGFPYWLGVSIQDAIEGKTLQNGVWDTKRHIQAFKPNQEFWVGETGWPTQGPDFGAAVPATTNLKKYYADAGCWMFGHSNLVGAFWLTAFDAAAANPEIEKHFGVADSKRTLKFALPC